MRILLLNQTFHPDLVSTAQHLTDLALALVEREHQVTVVTSRRAYDDPAKLFPKTETWRGITIHRIATTAFGKGAKWRRALDFASFSMTCCLRLLRLPRPDAVVALTSPPLISFIGAAYAQLRGARFFYWVMDLNPDEAIAAGWLREDSFASRILQWMSRFSFQRAQKIIALDRFMRTRIEAKGIAADRIVVIPPWSHDDAVKFDEAGREAFRRAHGLTGKFVVMYSGNHSPCHPLDTLLEAARRLAHRRDIVFCFVGGGSEFRRIEAMTGCGDNGTTGQGDDTTTGQQDNETRGQRKVSGQWSVVGGQESALSTLNPQPSTNSHPNILCLPYQPLSQLSASLSAADVHVVVMGEAFVGTIHPCKIYNVLSVGAPILYIGPSPSHLSEVLGSLKSSVCGWAGHGDVNRCVMEIERSAAQRLRGEPEGYAEVARCFSQHVLLPQLLAELEQGRPGDVE